jgi:hypothetical protein
MSRLTVSLKTRVRFDGRVTTIDRRATKGADLEKLPNPIWYTIGQVLRSKFRKPILARKGKSKAAAKIAEAKAAAADAKSAAAEVI